METPSRQEVIKSLLNEIIEVQRDIDHKAMAKDLLEGKPSGMSFVLFNLFNLKELIDLEFQASHRREERAKQFP